MLTRREFLAGALAFVAAACAGGGNGGDGASSVPSGSIRSLVQKADEQLSLIQSQDSLDVGESRLTFGLTTAQGQLLQGGAPQVYLAPDESAKATGPFPSTFHELTAYEETGDRSPRSPITGFYTTTLDVPSAGTWVVAAVARDASINAVGVAAVKARTDTSNAVGSKAVAVRTPVATSSRELQEICTRKPPDPMHYISLDEALGNGKPTVAIFATPLLCESRFCGPVVDEVLLAYRAIGEKRANFVHIEEFLPGKDLKPPPAFIQYRSPGFKAWHLTTEPWTFVIDGTGVIRDRFLGPVAAPEIEAAVRRLL